MFGREARRLQKALRALVDDCIAESLDGHPLDTRARLYTRITRHLPLDGAEKASEFAPPMWTLNLARKLKMPLDQAVAVAAAGTVYFSTADLADDIADGDLEGDVDDIGIHVTDVCRLTFLYQQAIDRIPGIDAAQKLAIANVFADRGQQMADGQELDLRGTDAMESADPLTIAAGKTGAEFAAMGAIVALAAGLDPAPWAMVGRTFGTAAQITSDYFDLFLDPDSDDWATGKPTLPIRGALTDPAQRRATLGLLAGDRAEGDRQAAGLWHVVQADPASVLRREVHRLEGEMAAAAERTGRPKAVRGPRAALVDIAGGIAEALDEYRGDPRPPTPAIRDDLARCVSALRRFIEADPLLDEATLCYRNGLFDADEVAADLFGPLACCDALLDAGVALAPELVDALLDRAARGGARYLPGRSEMPPDAHVAGLLVRVAARTGHAAHPAVEAAAHDLARAARRDGLIQTWLVDGQSHTRLAADQRWGGRLCLATSARALGGLCMLDPDRYGALALKGASALAERAVGAEAHRVSTYYAPLAVDGLVVELLATVLGSAPAKHQPRIEAGLRASAARLAARRTLSGGFGTALDTARAAAALLAVERCGGPALEAPEAIARALADRQEIDGGYPADRYWTPPRLDGPPRGFGARRLTATRVLHTLTRLDAHGRG